MKILSCSHRQEKISDKLKGKTILKFDFPYTIEFTDGCMIEFDLGDDSWRQEITFYEAGEIR